MALGECRALGAGDAPTDSDRVVGDTQARKVKAANAVVFGRSGQLGFTLEGHAMRYRIDQDQLCEFLARQARLVERLPVEATQAAADGYSDGLDDSEREAVWLAAGIATFIGQAIADEPERFIVEAAERAAA
jgi:hypothetical protein